MTPKDNSLSERTGRSPFETQAARAAAVRDVVSLSVDLLKKSPVRTNLYDTEALKKVAEDMMVRCADAGVIPSIEMLAACCGLSRRFIYKFISEHPDHPSTQFLDQLRTALAAVRISAADRGAAGETLTIFLLKNSSLDFYDVHEVEFSQPQNPMETADPAQLAAIRARYVSTLPEE